MDININKTINDVSEIQYDHIVCYKPDVDNKHTIIFTNYKVSKPIYVPLINNGIQYDIKEIDHSNNSNLVFTFEIEMLRNKSCFSIAVVLLRLFEDNNANENKISSVHIKLITREGIIIVDVTEEHLKDSLSTLVTLLNVIYVSYINNDLNKDKLSFLTTILWDDLSVEDKVSLESHLHCSIQIDPTE